MADGSIERAGVKMTVTSFVEFALIKHDTVFVATNEILTTLRTLQIKFPKYMMTIEKDGVRIYKRK